VIRQRGFALHGVLGALLVFGIASCGRDDHKPVFPVRGQVFFQDKPASGALVLFHPVNDPDPQAPRPRGRVDPDGAFVLSTYAVSDGAPAGDYVVTIDWRQPTIPGRGGGGPSLLPPQYSTPEASPLRATVREETNDLALFQIAQ
jgi:hypothetical protein